MDTKRNTTWRIVLWATAGAVLVAILLIRHETARVQRENNLKGIALAYLTYRYKHQRPPENASELEEFIPDAEVKAVLNDGSIEIIYGVDRLNPVRSVLAYEKDVPISGGIVVFYDGSVETVTPVEFAKLPKARRAEEK